MKFVVSFLVAVVFVATCKNALKRFPALFYGIGIALDALLIYSNITWMPAWFWKYFLFLLQNNTLSVALFTVVMYIGVLKDKSSLHRYLSPVRAELSILACILSVGHIFVFCQVFFYRLVTAPSAMPLFQLIATIVAIVFVFLMLLPLTVTSFRSIRHRMQPASWKKLQLLAYPFFLLIYAHILMFLIPPAVNGSTSVALSIGVYSIVFLGYLILRIRRQLVDARSPQLSGAQL